MKMKKEYQSIGKVHLVREKVNIPVAFAHITDSDDIVKIAKEVFPDLDTVEYFYMFVLNRANKVIDFSQISKGGLNGTVVDIRIVAKTALDSLGINVIFVHNHPSGNILPSDQDKAITERLKKGLALLDIQVLDHVIIIPDSNNHYSFANERTL